MRLTNEIATKFFVRLLSSFMNFTRKSLNDFLGLREKC